VPPESPTLGLTHLQFEALLTAARESSNIHDFALVAMLSLLGLRIFEATGADIADLGEEHGHRVLRVVGKGAKSPWFRCHPRWAGPSTGLSTHGKQDRSRAPATAPAWIATPRPDAYAASPSKLG
jgi:integrase